MFRYLAIIFRNTNFTAEYEFLNFKKTLTAKYTKFDTEMTLFRLNITFGYPKVRPLLMVHTEAIGRGVFLTFNHSIS